MFHTISSFIVPRLKEYIEVEGGYPVKMDNINQWKIILNKMLLSFEIISHVGNKLFCITEFNKNTKDDKDSICINEKGEVMNYDYKESKIIASGENEEELVNSIKKYIEISNMTMDEYIKKYFQF